MRDFSLVPHHPAITEITDVLVSKTQNKDAAFFRVMVAYFLTKMASNMRTTIVTKDRGEIPVNMYCMSLAVSGSGKGFSVGILENEFMADFRDRFMTETFPAIAERNLAILSHQRAARKDTEVDEELEKLKTEFKRAGEMIFTFDNGSGPAVKQLRHKLLLSDIGAINMQIDEIGSNLMSATEVLTVFLELYDQGMTKAKLTKNTNENLRTEALDGKTPANMLLFGTPAKLLDGSKTEDEFYSMLETGYARRCIFANGHRMRASDSMTPQEIYDTLVSGGNNAAVGRWANHFLSLADPLKFNWRVTVADDVAVELLTYRLECEKEADDLPEHEEVMKAELSHRYFKALKFAGALAFIDESSAVTMDHLHQAIKLVEESGAAFASIFTRDKNYVRLAKYISSVDSEVTHADLTEKLPFYKGSMTARNEMMALGIAWGYKNHILIKKSFNSGIEFYRGETLKETNLAQLIISYSDHVAYRYRSERAPFDQMHKLTQLDDMHWINHALTGGAKAEGHRNSDNIIPGFNMVVVDVDGGVSIAQAQELLKDYTYLIYTTKRSTDEENRFRIVMPINYELQLDGPEFKEFMENVFTWLPFQVDDTTGQRERKWATFNGQHYYNDAELLDSLQFIPKTSKNEEFKQQMVSLSNLDNLERWFAQRMQSGNRNNQLLRFAMMLVDAGLDLHTIEQRVLDFNSKLDNKLDLDEIRNTVLVTVAKKMVTVP
jgi:hypothetical protein